MLSNSPTGVPENSLLGDTLHACRGGFFAVVLFSMFINILFLTAPLYMLQIFDRVISSRSNETLLYLTLIAAIALLTLGALEAIRTQAMVRIGSWFDRRISGAVLEGSIRSSLSRPGSASVQGLRDLSTFRNFLTGPGVFPILDAPWTPIFIAIIFLLHPLIGWLALGGAAVLFAIAAVNEFATGKLLNQANVESIQSLQRAESASRNASVVEAMGMMPDILRNWHARNGEMLELQSQASIRAGRISAVSRFVRQFLQVGILAIGAWLVIRGELTPGMMIAGSILMARALAPVDQAIGSWKSAVSARDAYARVKKQLVVTPVRGQSMPLPVPEGRLAVEGLTFFHPGAVEPILRNISFELAPGEAMGLVGSTAAGKSTLAGLLVGIWKPRSGHVRLDGADVASWDSDDLGKYVGYLPQDIELFGGTVRENIARMGNVPAEAVISAAQLAGVHELILALPKGYETEIREGGAALSGGQRQRIALARAMFNKPRLVVLDEPNASLDAMGEAALINAIAALRESGATVVVIAHRPNILQHVDKVLILKDGAVTAFGPKEQILQSIARAQPAPGEPAG